METRWSSRVAEAIAPRLVQLAKRSRLVAAVRHVVFRWSDHYGDLYVAPLARDRAARPRHPPGLYNIELTNRCPFRCVMCPRTRHMTRAQGVMAFDLFARVIDEYVAVSPLQARHRKLWLHGFGESALHPEVARFVRYAADRGARPCLSANPLVLSAELSRALLEARLDELYLSLDGHDDNSFAAIRGLPNAYARSRENALALLAMKDRGGYATRVVLSMVDFPMNRPSIKRRLRVWGATPGVDEALAKRFTGWDGTAPDVDALAPATNTAGDRSRPVLCPLPWRSMTVLWNGDVVPCSLDYDRKVVLGNVARQSLVEIWNGEPARALREDLASERVENPLCRNCWELRR